MEINISEEQMLRLTTLNISSPKSKEKLSATDIRHLSSYLNDPVSTGLWRLNADWQKNGSLSEVILKEITKEINNKEILTITSGKRERKIKITTEWMDEVKRLTQDNLSFSLSLFSYLASQEEQGEENTNQYSASHELTQLILDLVDTKLIKTEFQSAFDFFKKEVWFPGFNPIVKEKELTKFRNGSAITLKGPRRNATISLISWAGEPLKNLAKFLELLGKVTNISLMPIFSPEEEVFSPYFDLLEITYPYLIKQDHLKPLFIKLINHFKESNFTDCVSAIGLTAEDLLTQVYETLFRKQLNKGLTLGQLADEIAINIEPLFERKIDTPPDFSILYRELKESIESNSASPEKEALEKIRSFLTVTIENNRYLNNKIDNLGKPKKKNSIFPDRVIRSINELIRYRNASSHKSRIPIGPYEATRSIYSLVIFLMWWDLEKNNIDWEKSPNDIIRDCVTRNN